MSGEQFSNHGFAANKLMSLGKLHFLSLSPFWSELDFGPFQLYNSA